MMVVLVTIFGSPSCRFNKSSATFKRDSTSETYSLDASQHHSRSIPRQPRLPLLIMTLLADVVGSY
jgi:hypothetical protein